MTLKMDKTSRGFRLGEFPDLDGNKCSIQDSSLATAAAIWFGVNDANPRCSNKVSPKKQQAWIEWHRAHEEFQAKKENPHWHSVLVHTRVHLDQEQAAIILELFETFLKCGSVEKLTTVDLYGCGYSIESHEETLLVGPDDPKPEIMIPGKSWQPFEYPEGTVLTTKMKLGPEQVAELVPVLSRFVVTGTVGE